MNEKITNIPLYLNTDKTQIVLLSVLSLPIDDVPSKDSKKLVNSNTVYQISEKLDTLSKDFISETKRVDNLSTLCETLDNDFDNLSANVITLYFNKQKLNTVSGSTIFNNTAKFNENTTFNNVIIENNLTVSGLTIFDNDITFLKKVTFDYDVLFDNQVYFDNIVKFNKHAKFLYNVNFKLDVMFLKNARYLTTIQAPSIQFSSNNLNINILSVDTKNRLLFNNQFVILLSNNDTNKKITVGQTGKCKTIKLAINYIASLRFTSVLKNPMVPWEILLLGDTSNYDISVSIYNLNIRIYTNVSTSFNLTGDIDIKNSTIIFLNLIFGDNSHTSSSVGTIYADDRSNIKCINCTFNAGINGGKLLYITKNSTLELLDTNLITPLILNGALYCIYAEYNSVVIIHPGCSINNINRISKLDSTYGLFVCNQSFANILGNININYVDYGIYCKNSSSCIAENNIELNFTKCGTTRKCLFNSYIYPMPG